MARVDVNGLIRRINAERQGLDRTTAEPANPIQPVDQGNHNMPAYQQPPYHFVSIPQENGEPLSVMDSPVWHDGLKPGLLSGEIRCTMTALTPLLVANDQYEKKPGSKKKTLEPLRLDDAYKKVLIPGSALKGMLRHSISALLAAPMERVEERTYSYRPNVSFATDNKLLTCHPAIVMSVDDNNVELAILDESDRDSGNVIFPRNHMPLPSDYYDHIYRGGIDGIGEFSRAFNNGRIYKKSFVRKSDIFNSVINNVSSSVFYQYIETQKHLVDDKHGHVNGSHPLISSGKLDVKKSKNGVTNNTQLSNGQLIYVEMRGGKHGEVVSMGHNVRYRWQYLDTVCTRWTAPNQWERRNILKPNSQEVGNLCPNQLTGARLLFGYVSGDDNLGCSNIGQKDFRRLAGRLAFNMAVEVINDNKHTDNQRFLTHKDDFSIPLKILGSPKPSAVEFYLQQGNLNREDAGGLMTYGDLTDGVGRGELNGRKFYLHQPNVSGNTYLGDAVTDQAAFARFISKPQTQFKFTLCFQNLREWELGVVLAVLEPIRLLNTDDNLLKQELGSDNPMLAHKLGHGRPLGLGSVRIKVDAVKSWQADATGNLILPELEPEKRHHFIQLARKKLDAKTLEQWLAVHQYKGQISCKYPLKDTIYGFHTEIRREHAKKRRTNGTPKRDNRALKPLESSNAPWKRYVVNKK